jgi:hypothetical protein
MIAFSERDEDPEDEETQTMTVSSVRVGERYFPASTFVRPAQPKDYTILGGAVDDGSLRGRWRRTHLRPSACQR